MLGAGMKNGSGGRDIDRRRGRLRLQRRCGLNRRRHHRRRLCRLLRIGRPASPRSTSRPPRPRPRHPPGATPSWSAPPSMRASPAPARAAPGTIAGAGDRGHARSPGGRQGDRRDAAASGSTAGVGASARGGGGGRTWMPLPCVRPGRPRSRRPGSACRASRPSARRRGPGPGRRPSGAWPPRRRPRAPGSRAGRPG